jgi:predicted ATP-binding protein involved in virulence
VLIEAATDASDLSNSLRTQLGLTSEQCRRLASLSTYASDEARKLDAIRKCFSVLQAHDWLYFPGTEVCVPRV